MKNQGLFRPKNPHKYVGRIDQIVYRSGLELKMMLKLDNDPEVVEWSSEEEFFRVSYVSPLDNRWHYYYPDFLVRRKKGDNIETTLIEIKPKSLTTPPKRSKTKKGQKKFLREQVSYARNQAKWHFAENYCEQKGWKFVIITEEELYGKPYGKRRSVR